MSRPATSILPNRCDVLPVKMRCTRAALDQYEVACRGGQICLKGARFSAGFASVWFALFFR